MKARTTLAALLFAVAGLQTAIAQGFRIYKSDGTFTEYSLKADSIVFDENIQGFDSFGVFTFLPVNQCVAGTWYKTSGESVTFNADGTTDYMAGATFEFMPYQGTLLVYNASGTPQSILKVYKLTDDVMILGPIGSESFTVYGKQKPVQLVESITLSETSLAMQQYETKELMATVLPEHADNKEVQWQSSNEAVADVSENLGDVTVKAKGSGTCTITCSAIDGSGVMATCQVTVVAPSIAGHEYVEIGGLKWATMNIGATTIGGDYATSCGDYFAWGETEPRYTTITHLGTGSATFTWKDSYTSGYSSSNWPSYMETTLDAAHDAAAVNWGDSWRMPTREEFRALAKACTRTDQNGQVPVNLTSPITKGGIYWLTPTQTIEPSYTGVAGILFVSASDISKRVFFPASGSIIDTGLYYVGSYGFYWISLIYASHNYYAYYLFFYSTLVNPLEYDGSRYLGYSVRPVSD